MTAFDHAQFLQRVNRKPKGPAEKRRLARRLLERQKKPPAVPPAQPKPPPQRTAEEQAAIRYARRTARQRRKIKQRQIMAARSGLPELMRRSLAPLKPGKAIRRAAQAAKAATSRGVPSLIGGDLRAAEGSEDELCLHSRWKTPTPTWSTSSG